MALLRKHAIFLVIPVLVVALTSSAFTPFIVFAVPPASGWDSSKDCDGGKVQHPGTEITCCWRERVPGQFLGVEYCQTCEYTDEGKWECSQKELQMLEQPPTPQPFAPTAPLQGGVLEQPPRPPPSGPVAPLQGGVLEQLEQDDFAPGFAPGFLQQQEQLPPAEEGAAELLPPTTEETQPAAVEEGQSVPVCQEGLEFNEELGFCVPEVCPEGQVLDEETGTCVLEEQPAQQEQAAEEPEEQQQQQQTEEEQSSEESGSEEDNGNN